ncbi:HAD-IA family hydrolase [Hyalangium rubrum]|uniref:HAD-IA family hydrolase n=1 Tax=Hyalangium rubrum TaxID=3103134 RepID=A0ABU5HAV0_9BACT|nr:HAD-IA family hydrolase [Hyalangium sp. s54d21]MDY7230599.1 HAD-IA family hydrolase [Hyalangium sp. s54d21]
MISNVVFDFDGTIANSLRVMVSLYNQIAEKYGYTPMLDSDLAHLRKLSIMDRCRKLGVPVLRLPSLVLEAKRRYREVGGTVEAYEGMIPVLQELRRQGVSVGIISSNSQETIEKFLERNSARSLVHSISCSSNLFGKDKMISRYLKTFSLSPEQVLYVGDEHRDVEACKKTKLRIVAVTWGADSVELLGQAGPDFLAHQPADIVERVKQLNGGEGQHPS